MNKNNIKIKKASNIRRNLSKKEISKIVENVYKDDKNNRIEKEIKILAKR